MKTGSTSRPASGEERRRADNPRDTAQLMQVPLAAIADARAFSLAQLQHQNMANHSSQAEQLKAHADAMISRAAHAPVQRVADQELLQGNIAKTGFPTGSTVQLQITDPDIKRRVRAHFSASTADPVMLRFLSTMPLR